MKRVFPVKLYPTDADGVRLQIGDSIVSTDDYHGSFRHTAKVVGISVNLILFRHDEGCCSDSKSRVWRCAAFLWRKAP
jgi:hypothetical protein